MIGLVLLTAAASATFYSFWPHKVYTFPMGSGGVLGISTAAFLKGNFARLGAFILICAMWFVGLSLLADSLIVGLFAACGVAVRRVVGRHRAGLGGRPRALGGPDGHLAAAQCPAEELDAGSAADRIEARRRCLHARREPEEEPTGPASKSSPAEL